MGRVLKSCEELTADVVNEILSDKLGEWVTEVSVSPLGEGVGLMSSIARAQLTYSSGAVDHIIVKCVAQNENSEISKGLNFYSNEVNFYQNLAAQTPIRSPRCLYAEIDNQTQDFLLILEDLGDTEAGDQLQGCSEEEMLLAFRKAGEMHARYWGKTDDIPGLNYQNDREMTIYRRDAIFRPGVEPTITAFPGLISDQMASVIRKIGEQFAELFDRAMSGPQTLVHGDYRIDNMFLLRGSGVLELLAVDWQNTTGGNGPHDIAYFSSQSCDEGLRGKIEMKALGQYHKVLVAGGVENYSFEQCLEDYRLNLLITMITPVAVCGTLNASNERGLALGRTMLQRSLAALETMECHELLR
jgi:hypothetical protein